MPAEEVAQPGPVVGMDGGGRRARGSALRAGRGRRGSNGGRSANGRTRGHQRTPADRTNAPGVIQYSPLRGE